MNESRLLGVFIQTIYDEATRRVNSESDRWLPRHEHQNRVEEEVVRITEQLLLLLKSS